LRFRRSWRKRAYFWTGMCI